MVENLTSNELAVLEYFFLNHEDSIHIRGLSDEIGVSYPSVRSALEKLKNRDLLEKDELSKMTLYSAGGEEFRKLKRFWNLQRLEDSGLIEFIDEGLRPEAVVLIGSFLDGRDSSESDIDLVVVGGRKESIDLTDYEDDLERSVELVRVEDLSEEKEEFRNSVANGYVLSGYVNLF